MRSFSKKLAFVLAAAMVVTSFAPAASAKAAGEMAINKSSQILYVNEGINHKGAEGVAAGKGNVSVYDFSVKNKPADWKDTLSFKWTSSDEDVVTVKAGGVATAVSVGKATITCKVTDKATKETVATLKTKITVKANADEVEIINADEVAGLAYEVGATVDLDRAMYDENGTRTTKRGKVVTDYTRWIAEPSTGVEIIQSNGKFTFTEAGEYTLYCETYQSSKYKKATAVSEKIKVTVEDSSIDLTQTTRVKFTVKFGSAVEALEETDVNVEEIVNVAAGSDKVNYLVKDVTLADDKKSATVEVFYAFNDGATYEVTVKGYDTETFVASNGAPKSIVLHSSEYNTATRNVVVNNSTKIWATLYDANGIDVTTNALRERLTYIIKYVDSDYELTDTTLFFAEVGERAIVKAEYHTNEYDDNSEEKDFFVSAPQTFVAVAKADSGVEKIVQYATDGNIWSGNTDVKMESTVTDNKLVVRIKLVEDTDNNAPIDLTSFGQPIISEDGTETLGYANFTSLVPDVLEVYNDGTNVQLYPRKTGTGRVMVSYIYTVNGYDVETAIGIVEVKVQAKPTLTYVTASTNGVVVCVNPAETPDGVTHTETVENPFVRIQVAHQYDQYGDSYKNYTQSVDGANAQSKRIVAAGLTWLTDVGYDGGPCGYRVNSKAFEAILNDMDGNGKTDHVAVADGGDGKSMTKAARFNFIVTITDKDTKAKKTVSFYVDARRAVDGNDAGTDVNAGDMTIRLVTSADSVKNNGNNVGRYNTYADNQSLYYNVNTETAKSATFAAYYENNGAKWDEIEILDALPTTDAGIAAATTGAYYYVVNKAGKNITSSTTITKNDNGTGHSVTINFSAPATSEIDGATPITSYADYSQAGLSDVNVLGAGSYEFILYQIVERNGVNKVERKASSALSVTCDLGGNYKLSARKSVNLSVGETDANFQKELLNCFSFVDRDGKSFNAWDVNNDGTVKFTNNEVRKYYVTLNAEAAAARPGTVYVEKVTFWEPVEWDAEDGANNKADYEHATTFAEYTVQVGCFVNLPQ